LWGLIILVVMLGPAISVAIHPTGPARVVLSVIAVVGILAAAFAWSGFTYLFRRDGVEIRTLGFRLRFIPRQAIRSYGIEPWAFIRGYGIRGIGRNRAYVWGNMVVHITTTEGEIYLGHSDPQRVVHDLDLVTGFNSRG
jgi:hypothetical protein